VSDLQKRERRMIDFMRQKDRVEKITAGEFAGKKLNGIERWGLHVDQSIQP
jgi:hypothetical protein